MKELSSKLGCVMASQGRDEEAYLHLREGFGPSAILTLECLQRRADRFSLQNNNTKARQLYGQIIQDCNKATSEHPSVLHAGLIMAQYLLNEAGERTQATALYRRICIGHWNVYGPTAWQTVLSHRQIVMILWEDRQLLDIPPYLKVVDDARSSSTRLPKGVVDYHENAQWYRVRGDYYCKVKQDAKESYTSFAQGLRIFEDLRKAQKISPCTNELYFLFRMGEIKQELLLLDPAKKLYKRYLQTCPNNTTKEALQVTMNLAWVFTSLKSHSEAETHFRHHMVSLAKYFRSDSHPMVNRARARLADCLEMQGRRDESVWLQQNNANVGHYQQTEVVLGSLVLEKN